MYLALRSGAFPAKPIPIDWRKLLKEGRPTDNIGHRLTITAITLCSVAVVVTAGRLYSRIGVLKFMGVEDYCSLFATLCSIGLSISSCFAVKNGLGTHIYLLNLRYAWKILRSAYFTHIFYVLSLGFTKASLLLQLLRLTPSDRMRLIIWVLFGVTTAFTVSATMASILNCVPPKYGWEQMDPTKMFTVEGKCLDYPSLQYAIPAVNIATDVVLWLAPLKLVWKLQLPKRQKATLLGVFGCGILVIVAACIRIVYLPQMADLSKLADPSCMPPTSLQAMDKNTPIGVTTWSVVECNTAIICCCVPMLRPLIRQIFPHILGTYGSSGRNRQSQSDPNVPRTMSGQKRVTSGIPMTTLRVGGVMDTYSSSTEELSNENVFAAEASTGNASRGSSRRD
ncbi:hypothetical protein EDC01DRAFT_628905 [Geopyxis carbonaria]|nr:hypothetical protein EDC01DRAFT_628905 [Geopyxis carbonaria]